MEEKQQVKFESIIGWEDHAEHGLVALLRIISEHPRLGSEYMVRTSRFERIVYDENDRVKEIITRNTHYVRED